jgi:hypothetical protein
VASSFHFITHYMSHHWTLYSLVHRPSTLHNDTFKKKAIFTIITKLSNPTHIILRNTCVSTSLHLTATSTMNNNYNNWNWGVMSLPNSLVNSLNKIIDSLQIAYYFDELSTPLSFSSFTHYTSTITATHNITHYTHFFRANISCICMFQEPIPLTLSFL